MIGSVEEVEKITTSKCLILDLKLSKGTVFKSKIFAKFLALILFLFEIDIFFIFFFIRCLIDSLEVELKNNLQFFHPFLGL